MARLLRLLGRLVWGRARMAFGRWASGGCEKHTGLGGKKLTYSNPHKKHDCLVVLCVQPWRAQAAFCCACAANAGTDSVMLCGCC